MRGFVSGLIWGVTAGIAGLALLSLTRPPPAGNEPPEAPLVEAPAPARGQGQTGTETDELQVATGSGTDDATANVSASGATPATPSDEGAAEVRAEPPSEEVPRSDPAPGPGDMTEGPETPQLSPAETEQAAVAAGRPVAPVLPEAERAPIADTTPAPRIAGVPEAPRQDPAAGAPLSLPGPVLSPGAISVAGAGDASTGIETTTEPAGSTTREQTGANATAADVAAEESALAEAPKPAGLVAADSDTTAAGPTRSAASDTATLDSGTGSLSTAGAAAEPSSVPAEQYQDMQDGTARSAGATLSEPTAQEGSADVVEVATAMPSLVTPEMTAQADPVAGALAGERQPTLESGADSANQDEGAQSTAGAMAPSPATVSEPPVQEASADVVEVATALPSLVAPEMTTQTDPVADGVAAQTLPTLAQGSEPTALEPGRGEIASEEPQVSVAPEIAPAQADTGAGERGREVLPALMPEPVAQGTGTADMSAPQPSLPEVPDPAVPETAADGVAVPSQAEIDEPAPPIPDADNPVPAEPQVAEVPAPVGENLLAGEVEVAVPESEQTTIPEPVPQVQATGDIAEAEPYLAAIAEPVRQEPAGKDVPAIELEQAAVEEPALREPAADDVEVTEPAMAETPELAVAEPAQDGPAAGGTDDETEGIVAGQEEPRRLELPQVEDLPGAAQGDNPQDGRSNPPRTSQLPGSPPDLVEEGWRADLPQVGEAPATPELSDQPQNFMEETDLPGQNGESALPGTGSRPRTIQPGATADPDPRDGTETDDAADDAPALARFAAQYEAASGLPRMAVVLVDDGAVPDAVAAVAALPRPVTVAIDPARSDATAAMAAYRAAGIEVMALMRLPAGAEPTDVAVAYEGLFALLPEAIGVFDAGEGGLQSPDAIREQALAKLAADGRGALIAAGRLNRAAQAAAEVGVALAVIDRRLDTAGDSDGALRRTLDQAAFRARQEGGAAQGGAVLLGEISEPTLAALTTWFGERGSEQVEIAPVSAILLSQ